MESSSSHGFRSQDQDLEHMSSTSISTTSQETFENSTVVVEHLTKNKTKSKMNSFGRTFKNFFSKSKSSLNKNCSKNSLNVDPHFLYNTQLDDFRKVAEYDQSIRYLVSTGRYGVVPAVNKNANKNASKIETSNQNNMSKAEIRPEDKPNILENSSSMVMGNIFKLDRDDEGPSSSSQIKSADSNCPDDVCPDKEELFPLKVRDSKTLIACAALATPLDKFNNTTTTTNKTDHQVVNEGKEKRKIKKAPRKNCVCKERSLELHRYRVDIEKKRLELLELKLAREREEIMHERVKFERDLEYKDLVINQIKEESSLV